MSKLPTKEEHAEHSKRISAHFEAQADLFTQCPRCKTKLSGTLDEIKAHVCAEIRELLGV